MEGNEIEKLVKELTAEKNSIDINIKNHKFTIETLSFEDFLVVNKDGNIDPIKYIVKSVKKIDDKELPDDIKEKIFSKMSVSIVTKLLEEIDKLHKEEGSLIDIFKKK